MQTEELTKAINNRLNQLKYQVNNLPTGGGIEVLRQHLAGLKTGIDSMVSVLINIDNQKRMKDEAAKLPTEEKYSLRSEGRCLICHDEVLEIDRSKPDEWNDYCDDCCLEFLVQSPSQSLVV